MSDELKACDRCNGAAKFGVYDCEDRTNDFTFFCKDCGFETGYFNTEAEAIAAWNTRPIEDALRQKITELEKQIVELVGLEKPTSARSVSKIIVDYETTPPCVENTYLIMECFRRFCWQEQTLDRLEAWQKDAVPFLKNRLSFCDKYEKVEIRKLIKQAEAE